jgi:uncharacterized phage protein (TIGR02218 family)
MTYLARENSAAQGRPVELYRFAMGAQRWTYTSGLTAVTYQSETYAPATIKRSTIEQGGEINRSALQVSVPRDHAVASLFVSGPPEGVVSVTIYRFHSGDSETIALWKGRVANAKFSASECTLVCEPVASSLRRPGLRARYQMLCRHALYSSACGALRDTYRADGTVSSVTGAVVQVAAASAQPNGYWVAGELKSAGLGSRLIVAHSGVSLTLSSPLPGLVAGMPVSIYAGCDHQLATCKNKFNNIVNFGGFPWIPTKNPFSGDAIV